MPGGATLGGGNGFMFSPTASPEQLRAGVAWVQWEYLNPDRAELADRRAAAGGVPVGLPLDRLLTGPGQARKDAADRRFATVPQRNYAPFTARNDKLEHRAEPPRAQQVYSVLDGVMQAVLTDRHADLGRLLHDAARKVDAVLAAA
jgi:multiple sugar transport system substrate-binding protein